MIVDAHQHFWRLSRADYDWLTPSLETLYRDFEPDDLAEELRLHRVQATVVVQAAATVEETRFLLELSEQHAFIAGVVGWAPLDRPEGPEVIQELAANSKLRALRPMIQDISDERWMLRDDVAESIDAIVRAELGFDALVTPRHLSHLRDLLDQHPDLPVVIDHGAKPDIAAGPGWGGFEEWSEHLAALATEERVMCKLSGLVTEASGDWTVACLRPFSDAILEAFGPQRVMWGSDWPVLTMNGSYDRWFQAALALTEALSDAERAAVFGGNAVDFYGLRLDENEA